MTGHEFHQGDEAFVLTPDGDGFRILFKTVIDVLFTVVGDCEGASVITTEGMPFIRDDKGQWTCYASSKPMHLAPNNEETVELVRKAGRAQRAYMHRVRESKKTLQRRVDIVVAERNKLLNRISNAGWKLKEAREKALRYERYMRASENNHRNSLLELHQAEEELALLPSLKLEVDKLNAKIAEFVSHLDLDAVIATQTIGVDSK